MVNKIRNSLSAKIFISMTVILLLVSLLIFGILRIIMPITYEQQLNAQLMNNTMELITQLEQAPQNQWESLLMVFAFENNTMVSITSEDDGILRGNSFVFSFDDDGNDLLNTDTPDNMSINMGFEQNGYLYIVSVDNAVLARTATQIKGIFIQVFPHVLVVILLVAIIISSFYTRFLAKPVVDIAIISKKMAKLDMLWQCKTTRSDEIGLLANNLNHMAIKLQEALKELKLSNKELQIANDKLQDDIKKAREHERRRRDFFTAVSHELKTPVTILKGELNGMLLNVGRFKDRDKYLQETYRTSLSIEKLVHEIVTLAKLDTIELHKEYFDLSELIDQTSKTYEPLAKDKQINIEMTTEELFIKADKVQVHTVVSNIVSNAVKHSPNGSRVEIQLGKVNKKGVLTIENSGVKIDEVEIFKLWEPFYRVEKSRNRETGGSGLGLYIVKTILEIHGFVYRLENSEDGVKFTIEFKLHNV